MEKKKIFISLPMKGREHDDIVADQKAILAEVNAKAHPGTEYEMIESCLDIAVEIDTSVIKYVPVCFLARSIGLLAQADVVAFGDGWENTKGCNIEHKIAETYGIPIVRD